MTAHATEFVGGTDDRVFAVRIVRRGDTYGRNGCLTHRKDRPMVEFYDTTYAGSWPDEFSRDLGQFVSRYYWDTLKDHPTDKGLALDNGIPQWSIPAESLDRCLAYLSTILEPNGV